MERTCFELLTRGADPNLATAWGDTPLHFACMNGHYNCIEAILHFKPKMNIQNDMLHTPLYMFISRPPQNEYILDKLLDAGANPDISEENGYSTLHALAIQSATVKTKTFARLLVEYKANVDSENKFKETPLHFAVSEGKIDLVEILVKVERLS
ncbi:hypothetical protein WA026_006323 [Henosepilachna vigintioctopunctata]|uniref:Ankyrin repeat protein n=1 Tax=Henosepilachna vigintioctopunctata TaxID=420089 RepID=A0AAW1TNL1_9CUCU